MPRSMGVMGLFWSDWREAAVLFVTYLWGKPQLRRRRRMRSPALGRGIDKSLKRPGPDPWIGKQKKSPITHRSVNNILRSLVCSGHTP
jgi:hypothetical protein